MSCPPVSRLPCRTVVAIERRVARVAEAALAKAGFVTPVDVLLGLGWLTPADVENWRRGRVPYLERVTQAGLGKLSTAMRAFQRWARGRGLRPSQTDYRSWTRNRAMLRFSKSGNPHIEQAYRTHWVGSRLPPRKDRHLDRSTGAPEPDPQDQAEHPHHVGATDMAPPATPAALTAHARSTSSSSR